jgi:hypothetical protein
MKLELGAVYNFTMQDGVTIKFTFLGENENHTLLVESDGRRYDLLEVLRITLGHHYQNVRGVKKG